eukprot:5399366-Amphidinium_carterae.1
MVTVQLECKRRAPGSLTSKEPSVGFEVGVLGRVACDQVSRAILLDWPGSGLHFQIRGRLHCVAVVMTIQRETFFDVHIDDKFMSLGSSQKKP